MKKKYHKKKEKKRKSKGKLMKKVHEMKLRG